MCHNESKNMRTIGIRVSPKSVTFSVYDVTENTVVNIETIKIPTALHVPEALKYVRSTVLDVLNEYDVRYAGIRVTETTAQATSTLRVQIEGVIQEAFASSGLERYYIGQIANISSKVGIDRADFKKYIDGTKSFDRFDGWARFGKEERESLLTALGAINA